MKKIFLIIYIVISSIFSYSQILPPDFNFSEKISKEEIKKYSKKTKSIQTNASNNYDLKYHRLQWVVNPDTFFIQGVVTSYFKITQNNTSQISFDLTHKLMVDSILFHNGKISFNLGLNDELTVNFGEALNSNQFDSISIFYHGNPDTTDAAYVKSTHNGVPIIWTLSEPYGAKNWWPCKQALNDKIDSVDIYVLVPQAYKAASNGMLQGVVSKGINKEFHWKHKYPIATYLIGVGVTNYSVFSKYVKEGTDSIQILNYVYPEDSANAVSQVVGLVPIFQFYDSIFGIYPFIKERYGHAQFGAGGGMEHQTMTFITDFGFHVMSHELAHQWFGDKITCGSWHDLWLNEGFATYITGLAYERTSAYYWNIWKNQIIQNVTSIPNGSVYISDTTSFIRLFDSRLTYNKGAGLLHMLRWTIGDNCFFTALRNYLSDNSLAYKFALSQDLINHFQKVYEKDLTYFFNQWIYGEGFPIYNITCTKDENFNIAVKISQTQSDPSVNFFKMPIPIKFKNNLLGKDTIVVFYDSIPNQEFLINLGHDIDSVFYDPEHWIVSICDSIKLINGIIEKPKKEISIYPNPTTKYINLKLNSNEMPDLFELYDEKGCVFINFKAFVNNKISYRFDLSGLCKGFYFCKLVFKNKTYINKIEFVK